jgi:predicted amidohydrolase YtcJ
VTEHAELLVTGGVVWTDGRIVRGADAIAIGGGRILGVGTTSELEALADRATRRIAAAGGTITPGCIDAHVHLVSWARALVEIDLVGSPSREACLARVAAAIASHAGDGVVVGRGWDANAWSEAPHRASLDRVTGSRLALLHSRDFHAVWANSAALSACGIGRDTPDPEGGKIERDRSGEPTGVLREHAVRLCARLQADDADGDRARLDRAVARLHADGVTSVHDFEGAAAQRALRALTRTRPLPLRVLMHLPHASLDAALEAGLESGVGDDAFRIGAIKLFADGTLGSRTAAMLAPYEGTSEGGMDLLAPDALSAIVARAFAGGLSVAIHAIGDRAVRSSLDAFEAARERIPSLALPPRIEHLQLVDPSDLGRLAALGGVASMQPSHCASDIELAERHWGARIRTAYPWRAFLDANTVLAFGSDAPVEPPSVAFGLHAAVTRTRPDHRSAFVPEQAITLDEALTAYTAGAARVGGAWPRVGTLRPGAAADAVVWDVDLHAIPAERLYDAKPRWTIVDGSVAYAAERMAEPREGSVPGTGRHGHAASAVAGRAS